MEFFLSLVIFFIGLCCGSFVNMLDYRTAENYELIKRNLKANDRKRSFCDYCGKQLKWFENIPIISWVIQRGRTRCCQKKLLVAYPMTELLTGILLILNFKFLISNFQIINIESFWIFMISSLIIIFLVFSSIFDLKYMILPDFSTMILIGLAILLLNKLNYVNHLIAAIGATTFLGGIYFFTKGKGMGLGDVKLAFFIGLFLGISKTLAAFYAAFISGALVGVILLFFKIVKRKSPIPFGPFLIIGTLIAWWWGEYLVNLII